MNNQAMIKRQTNFNTKIDTFKDHPKYLWLRQYANDALLWDSCCGYLQIKADDFINRIIYAEIDYIRDWLDGKNHLEWGGIKKEEE